MRHVASSALSFAFAMKASFAFAAISSALSLTLSALSSALSIRNVTWAFAKLSAFSADEAMVVTM
jgi:hypothetical protein